MKALFMDYFEPFRIFLRGVPGRLLQHNEFEDVQITGFRPKIRFTVNYKNFIVKTVDCAQELQAVVRLRHEIFYREWQREENYRQIDFDRYDLSGDHLIIKDSSSGKIVGTYRIICSRFTRNFYSQNEFEMKNFLKMPGVKLELGRACIHKDYRNGVTLNLIWHGLARYAIYSGADYLFGCSSVLTTCPRTSKGIYSYLSQEHLSFDYNIVPTSDYDFTDEEKAVKVEGNVFHYESYLPSLVKSYLKAGAKVYGRPAIDREFNCIDLLTILDINKMSPRYRSRYFETLV